MREWLIFTLVRALASTLRYRVEDQSDFAQVPDRSNAIFAILHGRLILMPYLYHRYIGNRKLAVLVSPSRDGSYLADLIRQFGFTPVRGSSSQRGQQGLLEIAHLVKSGYDAGWGPDGPRGPSGEVKVGMIKLAALTSVPVIPVSYTVNSCKRLRSWDRFLIPLPFTRCTVRVGKPIHVPHDADDAALEKHRLELQTALRELSIGDI